MPSDSFNQNLSQLLIGTLFTGCVILAAPGLMPLSVATGGVACGLIACFLDRYWNQHLPARQQEQDFSNNHLNEAIGKAISQTVKEYIKENSN